MKFTLRQARSLAELVRRRSGIQLDPRDSAFLEQRLEPLLRAERIRSPEDLIGRLAGLVPDVRLLDAVLHVVATHDTRFFRNPEVFAALESGVLPELCSRLEAGRPLEVWCAGCSTGQEAYSLAIAAGAGAAADAREAVRVRVLATDLSGESLAQARSGLYSQYEVTRGLPDAVLQANFRKEGRHWRAVPALRAVLSFARHNLLSEEPPGKFDLIFCRNVLMYFGTGDQARAMARLHRALRPSGILFVGAEEAVSDSAGLFEPRDVSGARGALWPLPAPDSRAA